MRYNVRINQVAEVAELVDALVSNTNEPSSCRFDPGLRYHDLGRVFKDSQFSGIIEHQNGLI